jgi:hypothetical protein
VTYREVSREVGVNINTAKKSVLAAHEQVCDGELTEGILKTVCSPDTSRPTQQHSLHIS